MKKDADRNSSKRVSPSQAWALGKVIGPGGAQLLPRCIWFTGLSGAGKSTIASLLEQRLRAASIRACILDGDALRRGINSDLGFSDSDRVESMRRTAEIAKLMSNVGMLVLVSQISPFRVDRKKARDIFEVGEFVEVFMDATLAVCERRDPKGLYAKARRGELKNFTGLDSVYEPPDNPDIHLNAMDEPSNLLDQLVAYLGVGGADNGNPPPP